MTHKDVSDLCDWQNPDDESLPLTKCVCGATFTPWTVRLSVYADDPHVMSCCGRRLHFSNHVRIYESEQRGGSSTD